MKETQTLTKETFMVSSPHKNVPSFTGQTTSGMCLMKTAEECCYRSGLGLSEHLAEGRQLNMTL